MKKFITVLSIASLLLTATTVLAKDSGETNDEHGVKASIKAEGQLRGEFEHGLGFLFNQDKNQLGLDKFVVVGTVASANGNTVVVNVQAGAHLNNISNGQVTVTTDGSTTLKAEDKVIAKGTIQSNGSLQADSIRVIGDLKAKVENKKSTAFGEVTAVTDNSVTIKNKAGVSSTFTVNADTKVKVNDETAAIADVHTGDHIMLRFKTVVDKIVATMIRLFG
ncbi:MAG TPA: DUF5666 domain-containing protein [Patescibacteria group bacterium]|jgi:hypothetical protein|nr:DUF5666 domain-containing protein [Patescibacteria group bacterium]